MKHLPEYALLTLMLIVAAVLIYRDGGTRPWPGTEWSLEAGCEILNETDTSLLIWCDEQTP